MKIHLLVILIFASIITHGQSSDQSPVQGDDLLELLGKRRTADNVERLNKFIGNKESKEDISFLNYGKGIQMNVERSVVRGLDFYNDKNRYSEEFKRFQGNLPRDMNFDNTIYEVKQRMGEEFEAEGELTGTYTLTNTFRLNDDDDYALTVEFYSGRMTRVSIMYIEGGSREEKDEGGVGIKKGFSGHDFFIMIKKNRYNRELKIFTQQLGKPVVNDKKQQLYLKDGVDIRFNEMGLISAITLYSGGQTSSYKDEVFEPYTLKLPYGIKMSNSRDAVIMKAGSPKSGSGNVITYHEGFADMQVVFSGGKIDHVKIILAEDTK